MSERTRRFFLSAAGLCAMTSAPAGAVNDQPLEEQWAPTEWGADDKVGSANRTTPAMVLSASRLIKQGKVATLGKTYQQDMPMFGSRSWRLVIPGLPTAGPFGEQKAVGNDEFVTGEIGQVGTQFDGPGHIGVLTSKGHFFYNGRYLAHTIDFRDVMGDILSAHLGSAALPVVLPGHVHTALGLVS